MPAGRADALFRPIFKEERIFPVLTFVFTIRRFVPHRGVAHAPDAYHKLLSLIAQPILLRRRPLRHRARQGAGETAVHDAQPPAFFFRPRDEAILRPSHIRRLFSVTDLFDDRIGFSLNQQSSPAVKIHLLPSPCHISHSASLNVSCIRCVRLEMIRK